VVGGAPVTHGVTQLCLLEVLLPGVVNVQGLPLLTAEAHSLTITSYHPLPVPLQAKLLATEKKLVVVHRLHQILMPFMLRRQVSRPHSAVVGGYKQQCRGPFSTSAAARDTHISCTMKLPGLAVALPSSCLCLCRGFSGKAMHGCCNPLVIISNGSFAGVFVLVHALPASWSQEQNLGSFCITMCGANVSCFCTSGPRR
jgi:hypothetical protein